jgi:Rhodopirellula transposase DDE domain
VTWAFSRGDPQSPLRWTCKSTRRLAKELTAQGHAVSYTTVAELLKQAGYSLQANRKTREGKSHPDRDAQFRYLNERVKSQ